MIDQIFGIGWVFMPAKDRLWLHVGPAKTGTKTIQHAFHDYRDALGQVGLLYPVSPRENPYTKHKPHHQHFLARAMQAGDAPYVARFIASLPRARDTVLSSEGFMNLDAAGFRALADVLTQRYEVGVVYYARNPVERATSRAQQSLKTGSDFYERICAKTPGVFRVRAPLEALAQAFGAAALQVRKFAREDFVDQTLVTDFCHAIGRPDCADLIPERTSRNVSMTQETAENILRFRRETGYAKMISEEDSRVAAGTQKFALPPDVQSFVWDNTAEDRVWLQETYGITFEPPKLA